MTNPFSFETKPRKIILSEGIEKVKAITDATVLIPDDTFLELIPSSTTPKIFLEKSKEFIYWVTMSLLDFLLLIPSSCIDFNDMKSFLSKMGIVHIGMGSLDQGGVKEAMLEAIHSPFLKGVPLRKARIIICNIFISGNETLEEIDEAIRILKEQIGSETQLLWRLIIKPNHRVKVAIFAGCFVR